MSTQAWLDPPEAQEAFKKAVTELISESDRGAALIGAEMVSDHLAATFERLAPSFLKKRLPRIISYPGVASSLSGRTDIAALNGWIDGTLYKAIDHLRRIRNAAAHSDRSFSLKEQADNLTGMLSLGENVPIGMHAMAAKILIFNLVERLRVSGEDLIADLGENPFDTFEKVAEELRKRPDWSTPLEERLPRMKLGLGVCLIISLMTMKRASIERTMPHPTDDSEIKDGI